MSFKQVKSLIKTDSFSSMLCILISTDTASTTYSVPRMIVLMNLVRSEHHPGRPAQCPALAWCFATFDLRFFYTALIFINLLQSERPPSAVDVLL